MSADSSPSLDARVVFAQASALAAHLQRMGVQYLPVENADNASDWVQHFEAPQEAEALPATAPASVAPTPAASPKSSPPTRQATTPARLRTVESVSAAEGAYPGEILSVPDRTAQLEVLSSEVSGCTQCQILSSCRTQTVFGEGNPQARFAFFGEGPGADEDRSGRPFVGKAGQLLTKMIIACKIAREDTYILNTVKCRPPGNRNPEADEIENCRSFYQQQFAIVRPEYIVCLGAVAAQELLKSKLSVGRLRGKLHQYHTSKVLVTYHPAYLLRNPAAKKAAWEDLQLMLADAGISV